MLTEQRRACGRCGRNRAERFYVSARARFCMDCRKRRVRTTNRDQRLQETYGITAEEADAILAHQGGGCAICKGVRRGQLDVDHSHALERKLIAEGVDPLVAARRSVRGMCCRRCNRRLLPAAQDSVERLQDAIRYLLDPPAKVVLGT